ncbi:tyrosine-type recombinase/integrase, partial [Trueperella bernardiae]|uniref:tyrosine-type recombinase/integrase n=1 Tax=Trueperella bernardiae TaxID=59561 RepID=UPI0029497023
TRGAASAWLAQQQADIERGVWKSPEQVAAEQAKAEREAQAQERERSRTFNDVYQEWGAQRGELKTSTQVTDRNRFKKHIIPYWGARPFYAITGGDVREWLMNHLAPGSPGARDHAYASFAQVMGYGHEQGYIQADPCSGIRPRKIRGGVAYTKDKPRNHNRHAPWALEASELDALLAHINPDYYLPTLVLAKTGLRVGELRALRARHVRDNGGSLAFKIEENVTGQGATLAEGTTPKTIRGRRTVPVPSSLADAIRGLARDRRMDGGYLFHAKNSGPDTPLTLSLLQRHIANAGKRARLRERVSPHDLRHTAISQMIRQGVPPMTVMDIVGHEDDKIVRRYAHEYSDANRVAIDALDRATPVSDHHDRALAGVASLDSRRHHTA